MEAAGRGGLECQAAGRAGLLRPSGAVPQRTCERALRSGFTPRLRKPLARMDCVSLVGTFGCCPHACFDFVGKLEEGYDTPYNFLLQRRYSAGPNNGSDSVLRPLHSGGNWTA